jgi:hypothetical protein
MIQPRYSVSLVFGVLRSLSEISAEEWDCRATALVHAGNAAGAEQPPEAVFDVRAQVRAAVRRHMWCFASPVSWDQL